jgi:hypothetical protein
MQTQDVNDLILTLTRSTAKYVYRRLAKNGKCRDAYADGMKTCIDAIKWHDRDIDQLRGRFTAIKMLAEDRYPKRWYRSNDEARSYYEMAVDQAVSVLNSIEGRFITGMSDPDPRMYRNRGLLIYEDEGIF